MGVEYTPAAYKSSPRVKVLDALSAVTYYGRWMLLVYTLFVIFIHLMIFMANSLRHPDVFGCYYSETAGAQACPPFNGFWDNVTSYSWFTLTGLVGAVVCFASAPALTTAYRRASVAAQAAHRLSVEDGQIAAVADARSQPYTILEMRLTIEEYNGRPRRVIELTFTSEHGRLRGENPKTASFPVSGVAWARSRDDGKTASFPDRTMDDYGPTVRVLTPKRPWWLLKF